MLIDFSELGQEDIFISGKQLGQTWWSPITLQWMLRKLTQKAKRCGEINKDSFMFFSVSSNQLTSDAMLLTGIKTTIKKDEID